MLPVVSRESRNVPSQSKSKGLVVRLAPAVLVLALASATEAAQRQTDYGLTPYLRAGFIYDSNLFRLSGSSEGRALLGTSDLSDMVYQAGGGLEYRIPVSQQDFTFKVDGVYNKYDRFDFLDYTSGSGSALWDWNFGKRWNGDISAAYTRDLQGFDEFHSAKKDIRDRWDFFASANYVVTARWLLHLAAGSDDQQHNLSSRKNLDRTIDRGVVEIRYTSPRQSYLGYKTLVRSGDYPNRDVIATTLVDNSYKEYENSLTVNWVESVRSKLTGRLGYTKREYDRFSQRDFSGATWQADWQWRPPSRFGFNASYRRDLDAYSDLVSSYVIETSGSLEALWFITSKVTLKADLDRKNRDYEGDPALTAVPAPSRHDKVLGYGVSTEYAFRDRLRFDLGYLAENRKSNYNDQEFDYYSWMASVTAVF